MRLVVAARWGLPRSSNLPGPVAPGHGFWPAAGDAARGGLRGRGGALELVSWMVARGLLEVRVAVPCDAHRRPVATTVLFHEKAGVVEDKTGDRLPSTEASTRHRRVGPETGELHVFTSWSGEDGRKRVEDEEEGFARLWNDKAKHCLVIDVPTAVREDLLRFLPEGDAPPRRVKGTVKRLRRRATEAEPPAPRPSSAPIFDPLSGASSGTRRGCRMEASASGKRPQRRALAAPDPGVRPPLSELAPAAI